MPWLTPDSPAPTERFCRRISIPNDQTFIQAVSGALLPLTYASNWEQTGTMTPAEAAEIMRTALIEFFDAVGCEAVPAPYWDDESSADDEAAADDQTWYGVVENFLAPIEGLNFVENAAVWAITGFVAYAAGPGTAIFFRTVAQRFVLAVQRQDVGELIRVIVDSAEYNVDTSAYAVGEIIEIPITTTPAATHDIMIIGTGNATTGVVRKRLSEVEMDAITDIQQVGGQLQIKRGAAGAWTNVLNADNVRRDGSTIIDGQQRFRAGSAAPALLMMNPNVGESVMEVKLPVTTLQEVISVLSSDGYRVFRVDSRGRFQLRGTDNAMFSVANLGGEGMMTISTDGSNPNLILRGRSGQSGNLQDWRNASNAILAFVSKDGNASFRNSMKITGQSSLQARDMAILSSVWLNDTDATRRAKFTISAYAWDGAHEIISGGVGLDLGLNTTPYFGVFGAASNKQTLTGDLLPNAGGSLYEAMAGFGFIVDDMSRLTAQSVEGERNANPALESLLTALQNLGLIVDNTSEGTLPTGDDDNDLEIMNPCSVSLGIRDVILRDIEGLLNIAVVQWVGGGIYNVPQVVGDYTQQHDGEWVNTFNVSALNLWLEENTVNAGDGYEMADALLDWIRDDQEAREEIARLFLCAIDISCITEFEQQDALAAIIRSEHPGDPYYEAVAQWIELVSIARLQYAAMYGALCYQSADCSEIWCAETHEFSAGSPQVLFSAQPTEIGATYKAVVTGVFTQDGGYIENDACWQRAYDSGLDEWTLWTAPFAPSGFAINGDLKNGDLPLDEDDHYYEFLVEGNGNPIELRITGLPIHDGNLTVRLRKSG